MSLLIDDVRGSGAAWCSAQVESIMVAVEFRVAKSSGICREIESCSEHPCSTQYSQLPQFAEQSIIKAQSPEMGMVVNDGEMGQVKRTVKLLGLSPDDMLGTPS